MKRNGDEIPNSENKKARAETARNAKIAILSVFDKTGLVDLAKDLSGLGFNVAASGGTSKKIREAQLPCVDVSDITKAPEMLGGRVKTLHPAVHGGILARDTDDDMEQLDARGYGAVEIVACNLYPFKQVIEKESVTIAQAVEEVDIGGVTLLRAAAKNHARVTVLCDPSDYPKVVAEIKTSGRVSEETRRRLAVKAFEHTAGYDAAISGFFRSQYVGSAATTKPDALHQYTLRYGTNPHQKPAQCFNENGPLPFKIEMGSPGYINLLDALNSWALVKELKEATSLPAAASFKHVSPAGAAVGLPLSEEETIAFQVQGLKLSPLAAAYARARGADRMSSFGDWVALSDICDEETANIISKEVSDGVIAAGFTESALSILGKKKGGKYTCLTMDPNYVPADVPEVRSVYGVTLHQPRNSARFSFNDCKVVTSSTIKPTTNSIRDLEIAAITAKYTQSNSVVYSFNGMCIGIGAGQQSRIHCTRLAGEKADNFWFRFHPRVQGFKFAPGTKRADKSNAIDLFVTGEVEKCTVEERTAWEKNFAEGSVPAFLTAAERKEWLGKATDRCIASDAFFPFSDNIHRAHASGVKYIVAPGGSANDKVCIDAANEYGMLIAHAPHRMFHH